MQAVKLQRGRKAIGGVAPGSVVLETWALTRNDLQKLTEKRTAKATLKKLRDSHHMLARLIAGGTMTNIEVAEYCGFSSNHVSVMLQYPAFKELVATYRKKIDEQFIEGVGDFTTLAHTNMMTAERMLRDKLEIYDEAEDLPSFRELNSIVADRADRLGHGKKQTNVNVNIDYAANLEGAIARSSKARVIEHQPRPPSPQLRVGEGQSISRTGAPQPADAALARAVPPRLASVPPGGSHSPSHLQGKDPDPKAVPSPAPFRMRR